MRVEKSIRVGIEILKFVGVDGGYPAGQFPVEWELAFTPPTSNQQGMEKVCLMTGQPIVSPLRVLLAPSCVSPLFSLP